MGQPTNREKVEAYIDVINPEISRIVELRDQFKALIEFFEDGRISGQDALIIADDIIIDIGTAATVIASEPNPLSS